MLNPPVNHSQVSVRFNSTGAERTRLHLGFIFPSAHEHPSFLCSGLGRGGPPRSCAVTVITPIRVQATARTILPRFNICGFLYRRFSATPSGIFGLPSLKNRAPAPQT